jgi:MATE family multidrug resistance protein
MERMVSFPRSSVASHARELLRLALPTVAMRSGALLMLMADIVMLGHASSRELAFYSLAQGPLTTLLLTALGLIMGTLVVTSQLNGAGCESRCGGVWRRSVPYSLAIGFAVALLCCAGPTPFRWMGQDEDLAQGAATVMRVIGLGVPGYLGYLASAYFLEGLKRPWPGTWLMVAGNLLNVVLNAWWIPDFGAVGAAWATTAARWFLCLAAAAWVWGMRDHARFGVRRPGRRDRAGWALQRRLGYAAGVSIGVEAFAFSSLNLMAGWFGAESLAAYAIGINLLGIIFMIALGVGSATGVRVGHAVGRKNFHDAEAAGWTGLGLDVLLSLPIVGAFLSWPEDAAALYTSDPAVAAVAAVLVGWTALILPFDGAQAVMSNALRGRGETWVPMLLQSAAYLGVMMPLAWWLSTRQGLEAPGLFAAMAAGSVVSAGALSARFRWLALRDYTGRGTTADAGLRGDAR